ncbi:excinuclease ABC subunit UvrC [Parasphaerochaeta coccoides]|uniref:UvrABC system protein C n=1 Tax=Parasphaerochaeta coccoides (strain ATCC BAA-1237 / DSM 17374 / SPN1) TaxID=760011 RepID=F4GJP7_PARC1|nr:excinuclease ABC subunit UvrC [Parasphaerochaeta coccoides]AEC02794.1 UvrABC system protein C [Parasphaerochaeta coccoides DSM 17374]
MKDDDAGTTGNETDAASAVEGMPPREQARALPHAPGVYVMKDSSGHVIYVGKAKDLRKRVTSYFLSGRNIKTEALVRKISDIDHIIVGTDYEALILENNLIKKYAPHYNISLKDGKSYPLIRITAEPFPKVFKTRRVIKDGSSYYGPYPDAHKLDTCLELISKIFPLRRCGSPLRMREKPCLYHHIGMCAGPCIGAVTEEQYKTYVDQVRKFLEDGSESLEEKIRAEMASASKKLDFETAAAKRDVLLALESVNRTRQVEDFSDESRDYAAIEMRAPLCTVSIMQIREGKLIGRALYRAETLGDETETLLNFLMQYYADGEQLPKTLYVSHEIDTDLIRQYFSQTHDRHIEVTLPMEGKHFRIVKMAAENAARDVEKRLRSRDNTGALEELAQELGLEAPPMLIEGFDIAQLAGKYTVASLISFRDGNPDPKNYRRFNIKSLDGRIDDFEAVREAIARRYTRVLNENLEKPGLIMIDGGKGQVGAAREILDSLGLSDIPLVGLAKDLEEIVFDDDRPSLLLPEDSPALRVLIAVRDECHRFATNANQRLRSQDATFKLLESVEGVGSARSARIMRTFGSLDALLSASEEDIASKAKIPLIVARKILRKLNL